LNKPETEMIVRNKRESKTNRKGKDGDHYLQRELAWLPSALSVARRLLLLPAIGFWGQVGDWEEKLEVGKDLRTKGLVKSWGHLRFLFIGLAK
jgi:hypothetical protein